MTRVTDSDLLDALRAADPAATTAMSASDAAIAIRRSRPSREPRRRLLLWASVLAAVAVIGVPAGAIATGFAARTGWFGSPNPGDDRDSYVSTESDESEWLDLGADDLSEVVASLYPEWLPLAPGASREGLISRVTASMAQPEALGQVTLVQRTFEYQAYRDWIGAWITAHENGDAAAQLRAAEVLTEAAEWPAMVATDGGGVTDVMRAFAERIGRGDLEAAQALAQVESAPGWDGVDRDRLAAEIYDEVLGDQE